MYVYLNEDNLDSDFKLVLKTQQLLLSRKFHKTYFLYRYIEIIINELITTLVEDLAVLCLFEYNEEIFDSITDAIYRQRCLELERTVENIVKKKTE